MLCLSLYVPVPDQSPAEFQYFESDVLPSELKSIFRLSVLVPSQEFGVYRKWSQVSPSLALFLLVGPFFLFIFWILPFFFF